MSERNPTLGELLQLSYHKNFVWFSARPEKEVQVNWVTSQISNLRTGDLLILESRAVSADILKMARKSGVAAVVIAGGVSLDRALIPDGLAIISLPKENLTRDVEQTLLNILINQRTNSLARSLRIHESLTRITAEGGRLPGLVKAMSEFSGGGVVVQDKRLNILSDYSTTNLSSVWENILAEISEKDNLPIQLRDRKAAGRSKIVLHQVFFEGLERIITPIIVNSVARGYLSIIDLSDHMDAIDDLVLEQGAVVCAIEMSRVKAVREAEKRLKGNLLTALLQENITPRDAVLWIQSMGLDLDQNHVAIRFAWDGPEPPSMRRLETIVNGEAAKGEYKMLLEKLGSEVVCICQVDEIAPRPISAISFANAVAENAYQEYPETPLRCGIGNPASDLTYWRDSFRQAGQALEMTRRLNDRKPRYFADLSVYRLLLQLEHHPDLQMFKNEILGPLIAYDGGAELIKTLDAYFEHNGVLSQAAEALFIHRNTLIYRMERIAEITGLDFDDTETRLAVQLALRIHRMRPVE